MLEGAEANFAGYAIGALSKYGELDALLAKTNRHYLPLFLNKVLKDSSKIVLHLLRLLSSGDFTHSAGVALAKIAMTETAKKSKMQSYSFFFLSHIIFRFNSSDPDRTCDFWSCQCSEEEKG